MENEGSIFEEYMVEKSMAERMKTPKFWIKYILIIIFLVLAVMIYQSFKSSWSQEKVEQSIVITDAETGWIEGKSELKEQAVRILPYISFKVKNSGKDPLHFVNFESVFEFQSDGKTQTTGFYAAFEQPLSPGETSGVILIKGVNGYTATTKEAFYRNKEKWLKVNAKLFARTKGSPHVRIGEMYPVEQKITGFTPDIDIEAQNTFSGRVEVVVSESGWLYKMLEGKKVLVYPSITFKIKNTGDTVLSNLGLKGIFRFEKNGERFHFGYPAVKGELAPGSLSDEIIMRSEYGIKASSLQALYNNMFEWDEVVVKILIKGLDTPFETLGEFPVKNEVKGVRIIKESGE